MRGSGFLPLLRLTQGEMLATAVVRAREGRAKPEGLEAKGGPTLPTLVSVDGNRALTRVPALLPSPSLRPRMALGVSATILVTPMKKGPQKVSTSPTVTQLLRGRALTGPWPPRQVPLWTTASTPDPRPPNLAIIKPSFTLALAPPSSGYPVCSRRRPRFLPWAASVRAGRSWPRSSGEARASPLPVC